MQANRIRRVMGIVNGTTNYILTRMTDDAAEYAEALKQAQRLGFAEADPTADVEGEDAASKLSIIASLASGRHVPVERIYREGITRVTMEDIAIGRELGFTLKMLAITSSDGDAVEARVHPTFIPSSHPLASVSDSFNAVFLEGDAVGELMLYGRGAGDLPTASSVISDIVVAARTAAGGGGSLTDRAPTASSKPSDAELSSDWTSEYYVRMTAMDKPGVLAQIAGVFGEHRISIGSLIQRGYGQAQVPLVFITHPARRHAMEKAINELWNLPVIKSIDNVIHVVR
jgi:homoserine dehydrogenase